MEVLIIALHAPKSKFYHGLIISVWMLAPKASPSMIAMKMCANLATPIVEHALLPQIFVHHAQKI